MLDEYQKSGRAAFIPFLVAGDPSLELSERMADALIEEGAGLLELGVPFSDALADGPVIQAASERAARHVGSIEPVLELAARLHRKHPSVPLILFTYYNPVLCYGLERFAERARAAGVAGALVVDLPPEEAGPYLANMKRHGVRTVFLASPTTDARRLALIAEASTGFIYYVSRVGVTGVQTELSRTLEEEVARVRAVTGKPIAVGFGISTGEHAKKVAGFSDAVVVGSAFVRLMTQAKGADEIEKDVRRLAKELVAAMQFDTIKAP